MSPGAEFQLDQLAISTFILRIIYPAFVIVTAARLFFVSIRAVRLTRGAPRKIVGWIIAAAAGWVLITALFGVMGFFFAWDASETVSSARWVFAAIPAMLVVPLGYGWLSEKINDILAEAAREITSPESQTDDRIQS